MTVQPRAPQAAENLIRDRAYDTDPLDEELRRDGIEMIAPHRANRQQAAYARSTPANPLYAPLARKSRVDLGGSSEFWPRRPFAFELRR